MEKIVPIIDIPYGKIAERVIVCGDPKRAERISKRRCWCFALSLSSGKLP